MIIDPVTGQVSWDYPTLESDGLVVTIKASNPDGEDTESWQLSIMEIPQVGGVANASVGEGDFYLGTTPQIVNGALSVAWSLLEAPAGMTINAETGVVSWTKAVLAGSPHTITIQAANPVGSDTISWQLTVELGEPVIQSINNAYIAANKPYVGPNPVLLAGNKNVTWELTQGPEGMSIDPLTGQVSWPYPTVTGSPHSVTIRARNSAGSHYESWQLIIVIPPVVMPIADTTVTQGYVYQSVIPQLATSTFVSWELVNGPSGMTIDATNGVVSWSKPRLDGSPYTITIRAKNAAGAGETSWQLEVYPTPPVIEPIPDDYFVAGQYYIGVKPELIQGTYPIVWSLVEGPTGMQINSSNGIITWENPVSAGSPWQVTIKAANISGESTERFKLIALTLPDILDIPDGYAGQNKAYTGPYPVLQEDTVVEAWSLISGPVGMTIDPDTGVVSWLEPSIEGSPYEVTIMASNRLGSDTESWMLYVEPRPDLVVMDIIPPESEPAGKMVDVTWTVRNEGAGSATGHWTERIYASHDNQPGNDRLLANYFFKDNDLAPDQSVIRTEQVVVPDLPNGYYIIVEVDYQDTLSELNESNNTMVASIKSELVLPDLNPVFIDFPDMVVADAEESIHWQVTNHSEATARAWWIDTIYLSNDQEVGDDIYVTSYVRNSDVAGLDAYDVARDIVIPGRIQGNYYWLVITDTENRLVETNETNYAFSDVVVQVDQPLRPDLTIVQESIQYATGGLVGQNITVDYQVRNTGEAIAAGTWTDRIVAVNYDTQQETFLAENMHDSPLDPNETYSNAIPVNLPWIPGDYYLKIITDRTDAVNEGLTGGESNNEINTSLLINVMDYEVTARTNIEAAPAGTPIVITGQARDPISGNQLADMPLALRISVKGSDRLVTQNDQGGMLISDENGQYEITFQPLANEAGSYTIRTGTPGNIKPAIQDTFVLHGMKVQSGFTHVEINPDNSSIVKRINLVNLGDSFLTDIQAQVSGIPSDVRVELNPARNYLEPSGSLPVDIYLSASGQASDVYPIPLTFSSAEGAQASFILNLYVRHLEPYLVISPKNINTAMVAGEQTLFSFDVKNIGTGRAENLQVFLPDNTPWMHLTTPALPALDTGDVATVIINLQPDIDIALGTYSGLISVADPAYTYGDAINYRIEARSNRTGDLVVQVEDEYTFWSTGEYSESGPLVPYARVTLRDPKTFQVLNEQITGDDNQPALFEGIHEGYYVLRVDAEKHAAYQETILVESGQVNLIRAFMPRETISYNWTVTETEIDDVTLVVLEAVFETNVPTPVITIDPPLLDLAQISDSVTQIDFTVENHGLIAVNDVELNFGSHPLWRITPLIEDLGRLEAKQKMVVPVIIEKISPQADGSGIMPASGFDCWIYAGVKYALVCIGTQYYSIPIPIYNVVPGCGGPGSSGGGGGGWIAGGGQGGPGKPYQIEPKYTPPVECKKCDPAVYKPWCRTVDVSSYLDFIGEAIATFVKVKTGGLLDPEVEIKAEGTICTCCTEEGGIGFEIKADVGIDIKFPIGVGFEKEISFSTPSITIHNVVNPCREGEFLEDVTIGGSVSGKIKAGAEITPYANAGAQFNSGCNFGNPDITASANIGLDGYLGGEGNVSINIGGDLPCAFECEPFKVALNAQTGANLYLKYENGAWDKGGCFKGIYYMAGIKANLGDCVSGWPSVQLGDPDQRHYLVCPIDDGCDGYMCDGSPKSASPVSDEFSDFLVMAHDDIETALVDQLVDNLPSYIYISRMTPKKIELKADQQLNDEIMPEPAEDDGVCAQVRLQIEQRVAVTRTAFTAKLEIDNPDKVEPVTDISVDITVYDAEGNLATDRFAIDHPVYDNLDEFESKGILLPDMSGSLSWLIVPYPEAAPIEDQDYTVSGVFYYTQNGRSVVVPLEPAPITVKPDPSLYLKYFWQRDVFSDDPWTDEIELAEPFTLGMIMTNKGYGSARNIRITSSQPKIVENEKGLLIDFKLIGAQVGTQQVNPSLNLSLGDLYPNESKVVRWLMTSTLQGHFIEYSASYEHLGPIDDPRLSLVDDVQIYELIHTVRGGATDDGLPDFMVNNTIWPDDPYEDPNDYQRQDLPDEVHFSDGGVEAVTPVLNAIVHPQMALYQATAVVTMPQGWAYLKFADPYNGQYTLTRVRRSDGKELIMNFNAWQTDRTHRDGEKSVREHMIHLFDQGGSGQYTLYFESTDLTPPSFNALETEIVTTPQIEAYQFRVLYTDNVALDTVTFDSQDIVIAGPDNFTAYAGFVAVDNDENGTPRWVTYQVSGPDGSWDVSDNGVYEIILNAGQVADTSGNTMANQLLGTFLVAIPEVCEPDLAGYHLMSSRRVGRTLYEYVYSVELKNECVYDGIDDLYFLMINPPDNVELLSSSIFYNLIEPGKSSSGIGTIHMIVDHSEPFNLYQIPWMTRSGLWSDFDKNGAVDTLDLLQLAEGWLDSNPVTDIAPPPDGDGVVNWLDYTILAREWLKQNN